MGRNLVIIKYTGYTEYTDQQAIMCRVM